jgi:hypothetical protein
LVSDLAHRGLRFSFLEDGSYATEETNANRQTVGIESQHELNSSAARTVHPERLDNRQGSGIEEGLAKGPWLGHADVDLLHQSCRPGPLARSPQETGESKNIIVEATGPTSQLAKPVPFRCRLVLDVTFYLQSLYKHSSVWKAVNLLHFSRDSSFSSPASFM